MKRIEPTHFIEAIRNSENCFANLDGNAVPIRFLEKELECSIIHQITTIAIFLIKPQTTSLAERMERRRKSNIPNYNLLTN